VDLTVEEGQLPKFDVDWADVNVGTRTEVVKIPKVRVVMEEEEIEVPYIDVDMPEADGDKEETTLAVEAEVTGVEHQLEIDEVYATGKRLYVIAGLQAKDQEIGEERMRVSDQLILNAPDLDVKYYIIGKRPEGSFNKRYTYINSKTAIADKLTKGKKIYSRDS
ncbi:MAG: hypothetical protein AAFO94_12280, partial [Bacteroidota bacterium]